MDQVIDALLLKANGLCQRLTFPVNSLDIVAHTHRGHASPVEIETLLVQFHARGTENHGNGMGKGIDVQKASVNNIRNRDVLREKRV